MKQIDQKLLTGERALFASRSLKVTDSVFADGESPLKESSQLEIEGCIFKWKYPLWYCEDVNVSGTTLLETARSGIWYTKNITVTDSVIDAPKTFRRSEGISLRRVSMPRAQETMWGCRNVTMSDVSIVGDYFGMNCDNVRCEGITVSGNYLFDGASNVEVSNSKLVSKDAFWNCENVTVRNCTVIGEYLAWNSRNVTFIDCVIESNQGLCYAQGLTLVNCKLINTDLAFEYSTVNAEIVSEIDSVKNPTAGSIKAKRIGQIIMEPKRVDTSKTVITVSEGDGYEQ